MRPPVTRGESPTHAVRPQYARSAAKIYLVSLTNFLFMSYDNGLVNQSCTYFFNILQKNQRANTLAAWEFVHLSY